MHAPKWKLFAVLWAATVALQALPYVIQRFGSLDVKDAFSGYPWNFSPFYAISLFGGAFLANRVLAIALPLLAYSVLNLLIVWLSGKTSWATETEVWFNYGFYALLPLFGLGLAKHASPALPAMSRSFAAAVVFFLLSNLPVFWMSYPHTPAGLADCYFMALPFFPATFVSALLFTAALFSPVGLKMATQPALK